MWSIVKKKKKEIWKKKSAIEVGEDPVLYLFIVHVLQI